MEAEDPAEYDLAEFGGAAHGQLGVVAADFFVKDVGEEQDLLWDERREVALKDFGAYLPRAVALFPFFNLSLSQNNE